MKIIVEKKETIIARKINQSNKKEHYYEIKNFLISFKIWNTVKLFKCLSNCQ